MKDELFLECMKWIENKRRHDYYQKTVYLPEELFEGCAYLKKSVKAREAMRKLLEMLKNAYGKPIPLFPFFSEFVRVSLIFLRSEELKKQKDDSKPVLYNGKTIDQLIVRCQK